MQMYSRSFSVVFAVLVLSLGCGQEQPAQVSEVPQPQSLPPQVEPRLIERLKARVPELRSEPQTEPQPRPDARPRTVPGAVADALAADVLETITGSATFYADKFEGRRTASGIPFRQNQLVAAHRAYPFGTLLRVTNLDNGRTVNVRVVDRGPFGAPKKASRPVIDLSRRAAETLGFINAGRARVQVEVLQWGRGLPA